MDDLLFRGGMILDGTGTDAVPADLAVRGGRITAITPHHSGPARRVVDARGLMVAPGFIDITSRGSSATTRGISACSPSPRPCTR
jgi:N-acyl-D-amino-acid deacylase